MKLNEQELAHVLACLRHVQRFKIGLGGYEQFDGIEAGPLSYEGVDELCEAFNTGEAEEDTASGNLMEQIVNLNARMKRTVEALETITVTGPATVLAEFVADVEVAYPGVIDEEAMDWPDLLVTYQKAVAALQGHTPPPSQASQLLADLAAAPLATDEGANPGEDHIYIYAGLVERGRALIHTKEG